MTKKARDPLKELRRIERQGSQRSLAYLFYGSLILVIAAIVTIEVIGYLN